MISTNVHGGKAIRISKSTELVKGQTWTTDIMIQTKEGRFEVVIFSDQPIEPTVPSPEGEKNAL